MHALPYSEVDMLICFWIALQGYDDLQAGVLRTPISPYITFVDDPLRVLRAVRFASRFGFSMVPELHAAAHDRGIHEALAHKISRERIGAETDSMLTTRPIASVRVLKAFDLVDVVCAVPEGVLEGHLEIPFAEVPVATAPLAGNSASAWELVSSHELKVRLSNAGEAGALTAADHGDSRLTAWSDVGLAVVEALNTLFLAVPDFSKFMEASTVKVDAMVGAAMDLDASSGETTSALSVILKPDPATGFLCERDSTTPAEALPENSHLSSFSPETKRLLAYAAMLYPLFPLGIKNKKGRVDSVIFLMLTDSLKKKHKDAEDVCNIIHAAQELRLRVRDNDRLQTALCFRNRAKALWPVALYLALAIDTIPCITGYTSTLDACRQFTQTATAYQSFAHHISEWKLPMVYDSKPLVDGKRMMELCGVRGAELGILVDKLVRWQLIHPDGSAADAEAFLLSSAKPS
jgi:tRNA nucleotidyltransferase/poly(A) polymerase